MNTNIDNYRKEIKIKMPLYLYNDILIHTKCNSSLFYQEYEDRFINNIYFDSADNTCLRDNVDGLSKRHKVRLRWYGDLNKPDKGRFEIKVKKNQSNIKIIRKVDELNLDWSWNKIINHIKDNLDDECRSLFNFYPYPRLINRYRRKYFRSKRMDLRLTLDTNLEFWSQEYSTKPLVNTSKKLDGFFILELKFPLNLEKEADNFLRQFPYTATKSSKYVTGIFL